MKLYLKSIRIENIKKIKNLEYIFPKIEFGLDNEPIIKKGILLTGSNFLGKTTFLQCLNTALKNDIGDILKPDEALSKGQHEGIIDLKLIDEAGKEYRMFQRYEKDTDKPVDVTWQFSAGTNTIKSYQSGSLTKVKKFLNYHYINPNDIIVLAQTAKGRRKLMNYFLNSVPLEVKNDYEKWDAKEQEAFEIRTQKNTYYATCKTLEEELELTPEDTIALKDGQNLLDTSTCLQGERDEVLKAIGNYNNIYYRIYGDPEQPEDGSSAMADHCVGNIDYWSGKLTSAQNSLKQSQQELDEKIKENAELENKFTPIITTLQESLKGASITNYSNTLVSIKTAYTDLTKLNTEVSDEVSKLHAVISNTQSKIEEYTKNLNEAESEKEALLKALPDTKPTTKDVDARIEANNSKLKVINLILDKKKKYNDACLKALDAKAEWESWNEKVLDARDNKKRIIEENNIEVEGFEFSPDGVTLKGYDFAERNISGAERRIAAAQFTMAMNSNIAVTILEEMESLDENQEQHMLKFAADRGYVVISDNVIKPKVNDIIIKEVMIK